jgi:hypothetical protein
MATPRLTTQIESVVADALSAGATYATVIAELSAQITSIARYVDRPNKVLRGRRRPPLATNGGSPAAE